MGACMSHKDAKIVNGAQLNFDAIQTLDTEEHVQREIPQFLENHTVRHMIPSSIDPYYHELVNATWSSAIPFIPNIELGYVIKVADGDSLTIATKLEHAPHCVYRFNVRLLGVDTPEMRGRDENEKQAARDVKKNVETLLLHKFVCLENVSYDKYGRILARVFTIPENASDVRLCVNEWLLRSRMAVVYTGGTKQVPKNWMHFIYGTSETTTQYPNPST